MQSLEASPAYAVVKSRLDRRMRTVPSTFRPLEFDKSSCSLADSPCLEKHALARFAALLISARHQVRSSLVRSGECSDESDTDDDTTSAPVVASTSNASKKSVSFAEKVETITFPPLVTPNAQVPPPVFPRSSQTKSAKASPPTTTSNTFLIGYSGAILLLGVLLL